MICIYLLAIYQVYCAQSPVVTNGSHRSSVAVVKFDLHLTNTNLPT
jgi:hypothetical protein